MFEEKNGEEWGREEDIRAVDIAEYLYDKLNKYGALNNEVKKILEKIIVEMKDEKFRELDNYFGISEG